MADYEATLLREIITHLRGLREDLRAGRGDRPSSTSRNIEAMAIPIASARGDYEQIFTGECYGIKVVSGGAADTFCVFGGNKPETATTSTLALRAAVRCSNNLAYSWDKPIYWIWVRNFTGATGPLVLHIDKTPIRRDSIDDSGAGTTTAFVDAQPIYPARDGSTTSAGLPVFFGGLSGAALSTQPVYETGGSSTTALRSSTIPATLASNTTVAIKHVFAIAPKFVAASTTTNLGASATYTSQTIPCAHDAGGGNMQTEGRLAGGFGSANVAVFSSHAGNIYYDGQVAGSATWRQIVTFVKAAGTLDHDTRHINGMTRARVRHVNDGTATTTFELFVTAHPRLSGYNNA